MEELAAAVREATAEALESRAARMTVDPGRLSLTPTSLAAAPFAAQVDGAEQVTLYLGVYGTVCEIWDRKWGTVLTQVAEYVRAVVAGRYQEQVWLRGERLVRVKGRLAMGGESVRISYRDLSAPGGAVRTESLDYEPY